MALTQPHADYTSALSSGMIEDYLVILNYYNSSSSGTVGISLRTEETINSVEYTPCITKAPVIREKIDLKNYTSSFGNVTLDCVDFPTSVSTFDLSNDAGFFSGEFYENSGSRYYINQKVEIYSMLNDSNNISKCLKIFEGRLTKTDVNWERKTIRLQISSYNPFDHIAIPITRETDNNTPAPITYGSYTPNAYAGYATSKSLWRVPIIDKAKQAFVRALLRDSTVSADAYPHYYDEALEEFVPIAINSGGTLDTASESYNGVAISYADYRLYRSSKHKPVGFSSGSGSGWTNTGNAFNNSSADDTTNFATTQQTTFSLSGTNTDETTGENSIGIYDLPQYSGIPTAYTIVIAYKLHGTVADAVSWGGDALVRLNARLDDTDFSDADSNSVWNKTTNQLTISEAGSGDSTGVSGSIITQTLTANVATLDGFPKQLALRTEALIEEHSGSGTFLHYASIYDIRITCQQSIDFTQANENLQSGMREVLDIDYLYCGADGYTQSYATSTLTTTIVDMHRDLIYRFGGITAVPTNWATLDSARSNYVVNHSTFQIQSLQDLMNKCQYEGNFIFRTDCQGAYKYIDPHPTSNVKTSTAGGTLNFAKAEIKNIKFKITPASDVVTKMKLNYNPHPATKEFQNISTETNTNPRTNYNFGSQTNENIQEINFEILNDATGISNWKDKRFAHYGEPRMVASFDVIHPKYYYMEVGDIFQFSDIGYVYGKNVSGDDVGFIIVELKRTVGMISIVGYWLGDE